MQLLNLFSLMNSLFSGNPDLPLPVKVTCSRCKVPLDVFSNSLPNNVYVLNIIELNEEINNLKVQC